MSIAAVLTGDWTRAKVRRRGRLRLRAAIVMSLAVHAAVLALAPWFLHEHPPEPERPLDVVIRPPVIERPKQALEPERQMPVPPAAPAPTTPKPEPKRDRPIASKQKAEPPPRPKPLPAPIIEEPTKAPPPTPTPTVERPAVASVPSPAPDPSPSERPAAPPTAAPHSETREPVAVAAPAPAGLPYTPPNSNAAYLRNPKPDYPARARREREEGTVLLKILVSADGRATRVDLAKSSGSRELDSAALQGVKSWRFVPAKRGDEAVEAWVEVPVVFRIEG